MRRGGSLVSAKVDDTRVVEAEAILKKSNWVDPIERRAFYEQQGWSKFDDTLPAYDRDQVLQERDRLGRPPAV